MKYFKKEIMGGIDGMVALSENSALTVFGSGEINFNNNVSDNGMEWLRNNGYQEAERKEFNDFFIGQKNNLDNLIKEL